jgi:riboflavin biosynthesis pyrimidine reductase
VRRLVASDAFDDVLTPYLEVDRTPAGACWVLANMVASLAGSAAAGGRVGSLSSSADAELFRALRTVADVVLVGAETVRREGYGPVRLPEERQVWRRARSMAPLPPLAIVTRSLDLDFASTAFTEPASPTLTVTCAAAPADGLARARAAGEVVVAGDERVEIDVALAALADRGHRVVLCEGGPRLLGQLAADDLLDELCLTMSPVVGGDPLPIALVPDGAPFRRFGLDHVLVDDDDAVFLRYTRPGAARAGT